MKRKLNRKGFTLIELLAAIVILGIISSVAIVGMVSYFKNGKESAEEVFVEQIKGYVDDYISLYGGSIDFSSLLIIRMKKNVVMM